MLQVMIIAEVDHIGLAFGVRPIVNGLHDHGAVEIRRHGRQPVTTAAFPRSELHGSGKWWLDLEQAESDLPGMFINQPLIVSATIATGSGTPVGSISLQARLLKK